METITSAQYHQQHIESRKGYEVAYNTKGYDRIVKYSDRYVTGSYREVELRHGVRLLLYDGTWLKDLSVETLFDSHQWIVARFHLAGSSKILISGNQNKSFKADYIHQPGKNYLFYLSDIKQIDEVTVGTELTILILFSFDFFRSFSTGSEVLPEPLKVLLESETLPLFHHQVGHITQQMNLALQQILHSPHQGMMKRMYLESKVIELLSWQLTQFVETQQGQYPFTSLKPVDVERVYQAKEILIQNHIQPPSLIDLAQQVGLHHMKLKLGFREIFGTTAFGCLRSYRLEEAKQFLQEGTMTVEEVANMVGYSHLGHFRNAFKRKFGITPGACRAGKKIVME
ncbi:MAG: AraC family transcriptional regulator [Nostoc sp.]|uniref:helix-turn-helix transcriptional regulator n=1 Tax=Nostoc sp. TaxID=1180 RepID=UPI002FF9F195